MDIAPPGLSLKFLDSWRNEDKQLGIVTIPGTVLEKMLYQRDLAEQWYLGRVIAFRNLENTPDYRCAPIRHENLGRRRPHGPSQRRQTLSRRYSTSRYGILRPKMQCHLFRGQLLCPVGHAIWLFVHPSVSRGMSLGDVGTPVWQGFQNDNGLFSGW